MADITDFKGIRYNKEKIKKFEDVITRPYDKIDPEMQNDYYERSEYNFVRVILGKDEMEGKTEKYKKAKQYIDNWFKHGVLIQDDELCLYPYLQEYEIHGQKKTRFNFITALRVSDYEKGVVIPHERTLSGPKKDRMNLLKETKMNTELIFLLYQDKDNQIKKLMNQSMSSSCVAEMKDDDGTVHKVYKLANSEIINKTKEILSDKKVFIADGHHRYETSLAYSKEHPDNEKTQYILCALVNMDDLDGLTILPTHRVVKDIAGFNKEKLLNEIKINFNITLFNDLESLNKELLNKKNSFGLCFINEFYLVELKSKEIALEKITGKVSDAYKMLDVAILHKLILEDLLGIDKAKLEAKTNLEYIRGYRKAYNVLVNNDFHCAFLLNATKIHELSEVASNGDKMPQKSTDFFPKLLSGFVMRDIS